MFGKIPFDFGLQMMGLLLYGLEPGQIDRIGAAVVGAEGDGAFILLRGEVFDISLVEFLQGGGINLPVPDPVQQGDEAGVRLPVDVFQLDGDQFRLTQGSALEEIHGGIILLQDLPFRLFHHRGELEQVADHQELHAAEGQAAVPIAFEHGVHRVEKIGPHHADFVDHQKIHTLDDIDFFLANPVPCRGVFATRRKGAEGQLKKRMQGHAAGVYRGNSGRCCDHHAFMGLFSQIVEEGGLTRAGPAGEKDMAVRVLDKVLRQL